MNKPDQIKVIPQPDRIVRKPDGALLDEKGEWVPNESYWRRRFDDNDIAIELPRASTKKESA